MIVIIRVILIAFKFNAVFCIHLHFIAVVGHATVARFSCTHHHRPQCNYNCFFFLLLSCRDCILLHASIGIDSLFTVVAMPPRRSDDKNKIMSMTTSMTRVRLEFFYVTRDWRTAHTHTHTTVWLCNKNATIKNYIDIQFTIIISDSIAAQR